MKITRIATDHIKVREGRHRREFENIDKLVESMQEFGLIHPIVVSLENGVHYLVAGERRLKAAKILGWPTIPTTSLKDADPLIREQIELEENIQRESLTFQEKAKAVDRIHSLLQLLHGERGPSKIKGHGQRETAEELNVSRETVRQDIKIAQALKKYPQLASCDTRTELLKKAKELVLKEAQAILHSRHGEKMATLIRNRFELVNFVHGSMETVLKDHLSTFDVCIADPPFAVDLDGTFRRSDTSRWGFIYDDKESDVLEVLPTWLEAIDDALKEDAHVYFFFSMSHHHVVIQIMTELGWRIDPMPIIWDKKGYGPAINPNIHHARCYEVCYFAIKGDKPLTKQGRPNVISVARVLDETKYHPTQKPFELIMELASRSFDPGDSIVDPFGGSGITALVGRALGARTLIIEKDKRYYQTMIEKMAEEEEEEEEKGEN